MENNGRLLEKISENHIGKTWETISGMDATGSLRYSYDCQISHHLIGFSSGTLTATKLWLKRSVVATYRREQALERLLEYRQLGVNTRRLLKKPKKEDWINYCNSLNNDSNISQAWRTVRSLIP